MTCSMMDAAKDGNLDIIEELSRDSPSLMTLQVSDLAIQHGHLDIIRFCVENQALDCVEN